MSRKGVVLTIGVFDGFHRGHQALVRETVRQARRLRVLPAALTFTNHPLNVLHHKAKVAFLYPRAETFRVLRQAGIGRIWTVHFTKSFARQDPETFIRRLIRKIDLRAVVVGSNFRFGSGNRGDVGTLRRLGARHGFGVIPVPLRGGRRDTISSSNIRRALLDGRVVQANRMLGRPFHISGRVAKGRRIGHELGYPTANLKDLRCFVPQEGIYACRVAAGKRTFRGGLDLGTQPTVARGRPRLRAEVHLLGFRGGLYGRRITIQLLKYLRPEKRFRDRKALVRQIRKDIAAIRRMRI